MALDAIFTNVSQNIVHPTCTTSVFPSLAAADVSEAQIIPAFVFLESIYGDGQSARGSCSRAQTPMMVNPQSPISQHPISEGLYPSLGGQSTSPLRKLISFHDRAERGDSKDSLLSSFARFTRSTAAKVVSSSKESSYISMPSASKQRIPRPSAMPKSPIIEDLELPVDKAAEYAIIVSMYEVYNDRIFDLLAGSVATAKAGTTKRRALLFKSTEHSPDRKVVAGLRKIVCCNLEEALMVLETGLFERKVAGTGSNAVSSRSHGFFCVEVKKRNRVSKGPWTGSTLTVVDLAGSERARQAKTTGSTLAEAGKINESLMYLGQCMQMQSDNQDGNKVRSSHAHRHNPLTIFKQNIVPFRQCKLTELLFSNSFPSTSSSTASHNHHPHHRNRQKAIMIVTADATGDFNATSQILRYSALAREITVPRIPSTASTILTGQLLANPRTHGGASGHTSPSLIYEELENANREVLRLAEEVEVLMLRLAEERSRREAAEACWKASEERMMEIEGEIRDEVYEEVESRIEAERRRWKGAWDEEADRNDEHLDRKLEILARGMEEVKVWEDEDVRVEQREEQDRIRVLEEDNERLRQRIEALERERLSSSPTKKQRVLKARKWDVVDLTESD